MKAAHMKSTQMNRRTSVLQLSISCLLGLFVAFALLLPGPIFTVATFAGEEEAEGWKTLFDGKTLEGWSQRNGSATYRVEEGTIVGTTGNGRKNSFLCSDQSYGDFELEFEVLVDGRLNSGVQIRSQSKGGGKDGRVNGPQVEIEAGGQGGAESGYVYGEATDRGWLTPDSRRKPHKHFRDGQWNKYRVVAKGPRIETWINGQPIEDLTDEEIFKTHPKGFIGLQVHAIAKDTGPYDVAWRNLRIKDLGPTQK